MVDLLNIARLFMPVFSVRTYVGLIRLCKFLVIAFILQSCFGKIVKKAPKSGPYLFKNTIEVKGGNFTKTERSDLESRLYVQLDDSSTLKTKDKYLVLHYLISPPRYDSTSSGVSARNIEGSLFHLGYYNAHVIFKADTSKNRRV